MRKDLNLNLSAVHENIRSRAYGHRFRNWFRVKASGSIGPMCFKSGAVACAPPIVRDESSRVFLGGALQQSPPLRRPSSMVGQFSLEVNRKDEPAVRRRPLLPSSKLAEMREFYSGTDTPEDNHENERHPALALRLEPQMQWRSHAFARNRLTQACRRHVSLR